MRFIVLTAAFVVGLSTSAVAGPYGKGPYGKTATTLDQHKGTPCEISQGFGAGPYGKCPVAICNDGKRAYVVEAACEKNGGVKRWAAAVKH